MNTDDRNVMNVSESVYLETVLKEKELYFDIAFFLVNSLLGNMPLQVFVATRV